MAGKFLTFCLPLSQETALEQLRYRKRDIIHHCIEQKNIAKAWVTKRITPPTVEHVIFKRTLTTCIRSGVQPNKAVLLFVVRYYESIKNHRSE